MCSWYTPEIDHQQIQNFDTLLATSLIPSSSLLQHNATNGKDKDKNVTAAPNYLFYTQLKFLFLCGTATLYKQHVLTSVKILSLFTII